MPKFPTRPKSFRLPSNVIEKLLEVSKAGYEGNETAAVIAAIVDLHRVVCVQPVAWVPVLPIDKYWCARCNAPRTQGGYLLISADGKIGSGITCERCVIRPLVGEE